MISPEDSEVTMVTFELKYQLFLGHSATQCSIAAFMGRESIQLILSGTPLQRWRGSQDWMFHAFPVHLKEALACDPDFTGLIEGQRAISFPWHQLLAQGLVVRKGGSGTSLQWDAAAIGN